MTSSGALAAPVVETGVPGTAAIQHAVVAWEAGRITYVGPRDGYPGEVPFEAAGLVVPGFVDCHTHLPFVGWRDDEYEARLAGATYRDLHGRGGGIARSARMLAEASDEEVLAFSRGLTDEMLEHGTTAFEMKTGYGLSVEAELRQARLARRLAEEIPQTVTVTLLAGHAVPEGSSREAWVERATNELIPRAAAEGLVDAVDVYVEDIAFTVEDLRRVAEAAAVAGLPVRCHAEQLGRTGAAEAAAELGARSADHLNHLDAAGIEALARTATTAVLLPASTLLLRAEPPPVAELVAREAEIALASDLNPGTSPVLSMPEVLALGGALYGLAPERMLPAVTATPARVLGLDDRLGTIEVGKRADLLVLDTLGFGSVPYRPGHNPVRRVVVGGVLREEGPWYRR
ncbi:MAG TPA: imidazolonepropionase [Actinomycetota bacterium]|nr:imidazolonepropionase [Actinomycetota bacterium]